MFERDILSKLFLVNWKPDSQVDIVCLFEQTHFFNYMVFECTLGQSPLVSLLSPGPQYWKKRHQPSFLVHPLNSKIYFKPFSNWELFPGISKVIKKVAYSKGCLISDELLRPRPYLLTLLMQCFQ